jgi:hypothetical protein
MIRLVSCNPGKPRTTNEDGSVSKGVPFRWAYLDENTGKTYSRNEIKKIAKKTKTKVIGLYNPSSFLRNENE